LHTWSPHPALITQCPAPSHELPDGQLPHEPPQFGAQHEPLAQTCPLGHGQSAAQLAHVSPPLHAWSPQLTTCTQAPDASQVSPALHGQSLGQLAHDSPGLQTWSPHVNARTHCPDGAQVIPDAHVPHETPQCGSGPHINPLHAGVQPSCGASITAST
jgi:hypothetical protein